MFAKFSSTEMQFKVVEKVSIKPISAGWHFFTNLTNIVLFIDASANTINALHNSISVQLSSTWTVIFIIRMI